MPGDDLLLVIDVQNGFVNDSTRGIVEPIGHFIKQWLATDGNRKVVLTRFLNPPGSAWERLIHWTRLRESPDIDLAPRISEIAQQNPHTLVADKQSYTSLTDQVRDLIRSYRPRRVLICGIATDGCVLKTAVDLFEAGETPVVLRDLCASHAGAAVHEAGLLLLGRFIGRDQLVDSASVL